LCTHAVKHLASADHIIALDADGHLVEEGSFNDLLKNQKYVHSLKAAIIDGSAQEPEPSIIITHVEKKTVKYRSPILKDEERSRQLGDIAVYGHYFSTIGFTALVYFTFLCGSFGILYNFSVVWLKFWSDENTQHPSDKSRYGYFIGIYAMIQTLCLLVLGLFVAHNSTTVGFKSRRKVASRGIAYFDEDAIELFHYYG
jgi:ATP-binding cassette subfamily C (CFTR/MRP) protein 1